jgi:hypothetical protein
MHNTVDILPEKRHRLCGSSQYHPTKTRKNFLEKAKAKKIACGN